MPQRVLILGGAGFLGSHLVRRFASGGWSVSVIDGLMPHTGGKSVNIDGINNVEFIAKPIESITDLVARLNHTDLVVDSMAWTAHLSALQQPRHDLRLNAESHLVLLEALRSSSLRKVILLGSRGQYGNTPEDPVLETTPMIPNDIQGVHKLAAESYFRIFAHLEKLDVTSLRLPNCFGERQPTSGNDIGLIGGFIKDAIEGKSIQVFGRSRFRTILYAGDCADIIYHLAQKRTNGFLPLNVGGHHLAIAQLAETIVRLVGRGNCVIEPMPPTIKAIDAGSSHFDSTKLAEILGDFSFTLLENSLIKTIHWFQKNLS